MKNYWIEKHNSLDSLIKRRQEDNDKLAKKFMALSETMIDRLDLDYCGLDREEIIQDCTIQCYEKIHRYEQSNFKGKARYYFSLCIECFLCQMFRSRKVKSHQMRQKNDNTLFD